MAAETSMWADRIQRVPAAALKRYFTADAPLGPVNVGTVLNEHRAVIEILTERDLAHLHRQKQRPAVVVGRRGSGKTSYLKKLSLGTPESLFIELRTDKTFNLILGSINDIILESITVESVAVVWDAILWNSLFWLMNRYGRPRIGRAAIHDHLVCLQIADCKSLDAVMTGFSTMMQQVASKTSGFALDRIADILRGPHYDELKNKVSADLAEKGETALVVLDSLDEYPVPTKRFKKALAGLLKCAGEFNSVVRNFEVRLCLPTELYWEFRERISTNPQKDFSNQLIVHWQVGELLVMLCRRLMIYLHLWHPRAFDMVRGNALENRRDADTFFAVAFPSHVRNLQGRHEKTDQYILRHTQLLPRQMVLIMSEVLRIGPVDDSPAPGEAPLISEDAIRSGIRDTEDNIVDEIFSAFRDRYGDLAKEVCMTMLPSLPRVFDADQFNRAAAGFCAEHGKTISSARLRRMLLEIGALGKVDRQDSDSMYTRGRFEYTMTSRLPVGSEERLCVHPLFSRIFECRSTDAFNAPILPWAAGL